ncbi:MAG: CDP-diacylglycerol--serine O-phosphatidyltransferase [Fusobacteriales bacterium]|nr:MAG: CDP-diacylglycerol--serine O-phosphatidyltransferase [Fusobacteriales bacterium]
MVKKKYIAPNLITAGNMFLGYLSITESIKGNFTTAIWFIILAMICDGLDGKTARKLDAFSEFGKEFDSFCDAVSFGLAPSMLVYSILIIKMPHSLFVLPISFMYALCGVMRLVKFNIVNIASSEKGDFSGMPIPNAAAMVVSYFMICETIFKKFEIEFFDANIFIAITVIAATLMVSTIPFKTPDKTFNFIPKKLIVLIIVLTICTLKYSLFIVSFAYVILNLITYVNNKFLHNSDTEIEEFIEVFENSEE